MKKIYFVFLLTFMFSNGSFASSKMREIRAFYDSFKPNITDDGIITAVQGRQKNKDNEKPLHFCIASYICSDNETRQILEEELGKDDKAIRIAKDILSKTGK